MNGLSPETVKLCQHSSRREWLRLGGLTCLGVSVADLLRAAQPKDIPTTNSFGRAKSCILIFLGGGPPQHETFDPKPEAPREVRGIFKSIPTNVPGMHFSELLARTARVADKLTIIRSMHTDINVHSVSGYWMLTGREHPGKAEMSASPEDWPSIAAVVSRLKPSARTAFSSVILPEIIRNDNAPPWPGQTGGFMGVTWHPQVFECNPAQPGFRVQGLHPPEGMDEPRVRLRGQLREQLDAHFLKTQRDDQMSGFDQLQQTAFDVVREGTVQAASRLEQEPAAMRESYGPSKFGQSLLLARRLVQAGVRLVQVNWPREANDMATGNPMWDTHHHNAERLRDTLCPPFDQGFSALLTDLQSRGLLDETLVVVMGEFGRTPNINAGGGRDHWGPCFSVALAGGGVPGGQIVGASDARGAYPKERLLRPPDLAASIFHLLGINPLGDFMDRTGRPRLLIEGGQPIREVVG